jgi:FkbM family methyltransferase
LPHVKRRDPWFERVLCDAFLRRALDIVLTVRAAPALGRKVLRKAWSLAIAIGKRYPRLVTLEGSSKLYQFICHSNKDQSRVKRLFTKEPGTIEWLLQTLRPDDVFFDIGANIGIYSVFAARELERGYVYAFEPHLANAASLLQNVEVNGLLDKIHVIAVPLAERDGFGAFHYHSLLSSRSYSQFGPPVIDGEEFRPVATEVKYGARLDALIEAGVIPAPTVVKIDVDGREADVVTGMRALLASPKAPRSMQIEVSKDNEQKIVDEMIAAGYKAVSRHWSEAAQESISRGTEPLGQFPHNVIFAKMAASIERRPALSLVQAG